jgi:hypothetical protein
MSGSFRESFSRGDHPPPSIRRFRGEASWVSLAFALLTLPLCGVELALAPLAGFLEVLVATEIAEDTRLLALFLEATQGAFKRLAFFYPNARHELSTPSNRIFAPEQAARSKGFDRLIIWTDGNLTTFA